MSERGEVVLIAPGLTAKTGTPKGAAPWNPTGRMALVAQDTLAVLYQLHAADALPVGPRTTAYKLSMAKNASGLRYTKQNWLLGDIVYPNNVEGSRPMERVLDGWATFKDVEDAAKRLRQAGEVEWDWISDGSAVDHPVGGYDALEEYLAEVLDPGGVFRDLRFGQSVVPEIYSESAELTPLMYKVSREYGVRTYSGRGIRAAPTSPGRWRSGPSTAGRRQARRR